jgi:hypothetical protein
MQQELRRFAHCTHEKEQASDCHRVHIEAEDMDRLIGEAWRRREDLIEANRIGQGEN